ncbi:MAG: MFS transporter [Deltaproteobacteria bacterium]|jgi:MFS family permease|nr:MFS transporter [Deltaproteobacteria bacterium]
MPRFRVDLGALLGGVQREYRFVLATFAASGIGYLGSAAAPVLVNALIEAGLDHRHAGDLGTIELLSLALAALLIAPYVPIVSHRKLAISGTLIAVIGLLISAFSFSYAPMIAGRIATGFGSGLAISGANAAVAAREDAERIFAIIWTMGGAITASLAMYLPRVVDGGDYSLGFGTLVLLCFVGLPCIFWLPPRPVAPAQSAAGSADSSREAVGSLAPDLKRAFGPLVWMTFAGMFLYSAAEQALWNFAYNLPIEAGVDPALAAQILAFTTIMGLAGGAAAAMLGVRLGRIFPIVLGCLFSVAGRWLYISSASGVMLLFGSLLWGVGFYFVSPYQMGLVAAVDRKGRAAVVSAAAFNFGYAAGPGLAGRILQFMDRDWLMLFIAISTLVSMLLFLPLAFRVDREARSARDSV